MSARDSSLVESNQAAQHRLRNRQAGAESVQAGREEAERETEKPWEFTDEEAPPIVRDVLRSSGEPLDESVRAFMEPGFGVDLGDVRVHSGPGASASARSLRAQAYTRGSDIVFGGGRYAPATDAGLRLIAHELTHVVQQRSGRPHLQRQREEGESDLQEELVTDAQTLAGNPERIPDDAPMLESVSYAFFYAGGGYGTSARRFFEVHYPDHIRVEGTSFEQMFDRLYEDLLRHERAGRRVQVSEIVIVTHANSHGGLQIPLARQDVGRQRNFTPWDLAALQEEFRDRTQRAYRSRQRFRERRQAVVSRFITASTQVVVRGCQFGQSSEGLEALRSFFGGSVYVWAPTGFQGYQVATIGRSHLGSAEEAFDMLEAQGLVPQDMGLSADEKRLYLQRELGIQGSVPSEFFVMGEDDYRALRQLTAQNQGLSEEAEQHVTREGVDLPSSGEYWGLSAPRSGGEDPELDALSIEEIERRARILYQSYQPSYAPMLIRLRNAWERKPLDQTLRGCEDNMDPLCGLPPMGIFGDSNILAGDAARFRWTTTNFDSFEQTTLPFAPPLEGAAAANEYDEGLGETDEPAERGGVTSTQATPTAGRRSPTPAQLAAARDFSKRLPEPEELAEAPVDLDRLLAMLDTDPGILAILLTLPETGWQASDYLSALDLTISGVSGIPTVLSLESFLGISAFGWELIGLLSPLLTIAGVVATISEAADAQTAGAQALGIRLGLDHMVLDAFGRQPHDVDRWMEEVRNGQDMYWQVALGYPLSPDAVRAYVRSGMNMVASDADAAFSAGLQRVRAHLRQVGVPESQIESRIEELSAAVRRVVLTAFYRRGQQALQQRRDARAGQR